MQLAVIIIITLAAKTSVTNIKFFPQQLATITREHKTYLHTTLAL